MKKFYLLMATILLMAMPFVLFAEEQEVEIELIEVVGASVLPGDNPVLTLPILHSFTQPSPVACSRSM